MGVRALWLGVPMALGPLWWEGGGGEWAQGGLYVGQVLGGVRAL